MEYKNIYKCKFCQRIIFEDDEDIERDIELVVHMYEKHCLLHRCYNDDIILGFAERVGFKKVEEEPIRIPEDFEF